MTEAKKQQTFFNQFLACLLICFEHETGDEMCTTIFNRMLMNF